MDELSKSFPPGVRYDIPYDTTRFIEVSIKEVIKTLVEAMILVILVVYLFLQSWRATIIPAVAVPVSLIGTFAGMEALGFSINTLTLFGMVLAIGIVVDDAIVVVENVERHMEEEAVAQGGGQEGDDGSDADRSSPSSWSLCAVFVPVGFLGGITGQLYKQFAITIAIAVDHLRIGGVDAESCPVRPGVEAGPRARRGGFFRTFQSILRLDAGPIY